MPATITLKDIPDRVCEQLKASAEASRRSLNSEAIAAGAKPRKAFEACAVALTEI